jgi:integrase
MSLQRFASDLSKRLTGVSIDVPTVQQFFADWLESKRQRKAAKATIERYGTAKKLFLESLNETVLAPITAIGPKHLESFLQSRLKNGAASKTVVVDIKILRTAFNQAVRWGQIVSNPANAITLPEVESHQREVFSIDEIKKLFETAKEEESEWATMILLGATTGARLKDCANMRWENINWDASTIKYTQAKTGKTGEVPIHFDLDDHLDYDGSRPQKSGFICPKLAARTVGGKHGLSNSFIRLMKRAGVDAMTVKGKGKRKFSKRSFHSLRYTFNSLLYEKGVAQEVRRKMIGHSSVFMNDHYTKPALAPLKNARDKFPSVW